MGVPGISALGGPDGRGGPHVFVDDLDAPVLGADDRHHLERVLRVRDGDPLTVSDGVGGWRVCRFGDPLEPVGAVGHERAPVPELAVGFVPVKGDRPEWVVQKLTELGIDHIVVMASDRSVVRWDGERGVRHVERLRKVAREAAMQCRRCRLPRIDGVVPVTELAGDPGVVRAEVGGAEPSLDHRLVLIGPEGGWSDPERELVPATVGLADHVLRAETAAVTASALYTALRAHRVEETAHPPPVDTEGD
ncbi:MAG: RsmE family RNA methyltransferase [Acidimicrobiales bacterium]